MQQEAGVIVVKWVFKTGILSMAVLDSAFGHLFKGLWHWGPKDAVRDVAAGSLVGIFQGVDTRFIYRQNETGSRAMSPVSSDSEKEKKSGKRNSLSKLFCHFKIDTF